MIVAVCALGIAQITAWGTSYYCLGVLAGPIAADTGWSRGLVYFGFTVALLAMGLVSAWAGRVIDRHGARGVMSAGIVLVSASLYALAQVRIGSGLPGRVGGDRRRHALLPVRRGVRGAGADRARARAPGDLLPHAVRRVRLVGVLGARPLLQRGLRLAAHARVVRADQRRRLPAADPRGAGAARCPGRERSGRDAGGRDARRPAAAGPRAQDRDRPVRRDHVAQRLRVRRRHGATGAAARGRGPDRRRGRLDRFAQGLRAVRRPRGRDLLRQQAARDHRGAPGDRRAAAVVPAAAVCRRQRPGDPRVHAADGRLAGRDHHRARGGAARALRRQRLRHGARFHRHAHPGGQRGLAVAVRAGRGPLGLAAGAARAARLRVGVLPGDGTDVALVRTKPRRSRAGVDPRQERGPAGR